MTTAEFNTHVSVVRQQDWAATLADRDFGPAEEEA